MKIFPDDTLPLAVHHPAIAVALLIVIWLGSALAITGWTFAYFNGRFPDTHRGTRRFDWVWSIFFGLLAGLLGPLGIMLTLMLSGGGKYGWRIGGVKKPNNPHDH